MISPQFQNALSKLLEKGTIDHLDDSQLELLRGVTIRSENAQENPYRENCDLFTLCKENWSKYLPYTSFFTEMDDDIEEVIGPAKINPLDRSDGKRFLSVQLNQKVLIESIRTNLRREDFSFGNSTKYAIGLIGLTNAAELCDDLYQALEENIDQSKIDVGFRSMAFFSLTMLGETRIERIAKEWLKLSERDSDEYFIISFFMQQYPDFFKGDEIAEYVRQLPSSKISKLPYCILKRSCDNGFNLEKITNSPIPSDRENPIYAIARSSSSKLRSRIDLNELDASEMILLADTVLTYRNKQAARWDTYKNSHLPTPLVFEFVGIILDNWSTDKILTKLKNRSDSELQVLALAGFVNAKNKIKWLNEVEEILDKLGQPFGILSAVRSTLSGKDSSYCLRQFLDSGFSYLSWQILYCYIVAMESLGDLENVHVLFKSLLKQIRSESAQEWEESIGIYPDQLTFFLPCYEYRQVIACGNKSLPYGDDESKLFANVYSWLKNDQSFISKNLDQLISRKELSASDIQCQLLLADAHLLPLQNIYRQLWECYSADSDNLLEGNFDPQIAAFLQLNDDSTHTNKALQIYANNLSTCEFIFKAILLRCDDENTLRKAIKLLDKDAIRDPFLADLKRLLSSSITAPEDFYNMEGIALSPNPIIRQFFIKWARKHPPTDKVHLSELTRILKHLAENPNSESAAMAMEALYKINPSEQEWVWEYARDQLNNENTLLESRDILVDIIKLKPSVESLLVYCNSYNSDQLRRIGSSSEPVLMWKQVRENIPEGIYMLTSESGEQAALQFNEPAPDFFDFRGKEGALQWIADYMSQKSAAAFVNEQQDRRVVISPLKTKVPILSNPIQSDDFWKIAEHIEITYIDESSGSILGKINPSKKSPEILSALFETDSVAVFSAEWC